MFDYESDDPNSDPAPQPTSPGADGALFDAVAGMYVSLLGRPGSPEEINKWILDTGGDIYKIQQGLFNSAEGQAYLSRNAQTPGPETPIPPPPPPPPPPTGGGDLLAPWTTPVPSRTDQPLPDAPVFHAPTGDDVYSDPGYIFRRDEGQHGLENSAAAKGLLRSGGTLKDFSRFNQTFASQEYGNVYDRKAHEFGDLKDIWGTQVNATQHSNDMDWEAIWNKYNAEYDIFKRNQEWPYKVLNDQQNVYPNVAR